MKNILALLSLLALLSGCSGRMTINDALQQGASQLDRGTIKKLVAGNTLHMVAWDRSEKADVEFAKQGGKLRATNVLGGSTAGRWRVADNKLCLEFMWWGNESGMECYSVHKLKDRYLLFQADGSLVDTFVPEYEVEYTSGDVRNVGVLGKLPAEWTTEGAAVGGATSAAVALMPPVAEGKKISSHHQLLLDSNECPGCDLAGVDLSGLSLEGANLAGADLSGAKLIESKLKGANLQGANLQNSNLHWADLSKADLRNASLQGASLVKTVFYQADLTGADLSDVKCQRTIFSKAKGVPAELITK